MNEMLAGKVALITGAARGIGFATAGLFAAEGCTLALSDLDAAELASAARSLRERGARVLECPGDLTTPGVPESTVDAVLEAFGGLDILVNNAGATADAVIHRMTDEQFDAMLRIHLRAPFQLIRAAAPFFRETARREQERGIVTPRKIVNISSVSGTLGIAGQANYSAAKAGIIGMTRTLAREWGRFHVNCNAVAFGLIATRLTQPKDAQGSGMPSEAIDEMVRQIPLGRAGTPREAAGAILFLASGLSDYVSGTVLNVSGGLGC
jgi:3-oxoacyl-[acyl-carrier protein] reductase